MLVNKQPKTFKTLNGVIDYFEHISLQKFQHTPSFDLIVSNPPYFENNLKTNTNSEHKRAIQIHFLLNYSLKAVPNY